MKIQIVGCGEAFDSGLGNNSFLVTTPARKPNPATRVLIDCGYQIPERLWQLQLHSKLNGLYLTHTHADHSFGVVPLLTRYWEEKRQAPFTIIGHSGVRSYVNKLMQLGYPRMLAKLPFELEFIVVKPTQPLNWRGITLATAKSEHGVKNLSVRLNYDQKSCAFSGDGSITPATTALYDGVDILFHELFATRKDINGHTNIRALEQLTESTNIGKIVVSHHSRHYKTAIKRALAKQDSTASSRLWESAEPNAQFSI